MPFKSQSHAGRLSFNPQPQSLGEPARSLCDDRRPSTDRKLLLSDPLLIQLPQPYQSLAATPCRCSELSSHDIVQFAQLKPKQNITSNSFPCISACLRCYGYEGIKIILNLSLLDEIDLSNARKNVQQQKLI